MDTEYYLQDELGSPIRLINKEGRQTEAYGYDEFGQDLYGNQGQIQPFGYTGYQNDQLAGTYFAQAREYFSLAGKFFSRDLDKFISLENIGSLNLYNYCLLNPIHYIDPQGHNLEDIYPLVAYNKNNPVQINASKNNIAIDVYVDFKVDKTFSIESGTLYKEKAIEGIENWAGNYQDVFNEDVEVDINIYERNSNLGSSQRYIKIYLENEAGIPRTRCKSAKWSVSSSKIIKMYNVDSRTNHRFSMEEYERTITHEMGHVFGIEDGYKGAKPNFWQNIFGITTRPDAYELGIIDKDDVMRYHYDRLNISNIDIGMLILAYWEGKHQSYADYTGHKQSNYFNHEEKE